MRQRFEAGLGTCINSLSFDYPAGFEVPEHAHRSAQLVYAVSGVMEVTAERSRWLVPPQFGIWIPAGTRHSIHMQRPVSMRTLYLLPHLVGLRSCQVMHMTPLLRELVLETVSMGSLRSHRQADAALRDVLVAAIRKAKSLEIQLTLPDDERARRLAERVLREPHARQSLPVRCARAGISVRTLQRIFQNQLGMDFATWRRQARLLKAVELLASGESIQKVSFAVGYGHPSTFSSMFRRVFGVTPKAWVEQLKPRRGGGRAARRR